MENDIILPRELANGNYSLEEIGTLVVLMCLPSMKDTELEDWMDDEKFTSHVDRLIQEGIVTKQEVDGELHLTIDLV